MSWAAAPASAMARPDFRLPFSCGQSWRLSTYTGHDPDDKKLDMFRTGGTTSGSAVLASAAGTVHQWFDPGGVEIDHGNGWFTVYLHMSARAGVGTHVAQGDWIGTVGSVGTGSAHLHYEQLYDSSGDGDGETDEMVYPIIQGTEYRLSPAGPFPVVTSTNKCTGGGNGGKYWVDTFADATGYAQPNTSDPQGLLYKGTNYVFCKRLGDPFTGPEGHNHWWLKTDLDEVYPGKNGWGAYVSAYYLSRWGNDEARDNSGTVIPDC
ncbi:M23 family metallopeptidase [Sphaerisporangium corydalis]|uniref:M23 family metallopeptidase n=1 Tax=Sphaerisporangium corydalis TaxID=1441875 RepID=A0ABV9EQZ1_9ACTN|nr:M23 family metallopeptidase [Sphaerisporangium corydalis]